MPAISPVHQDELPHGHIVSIVGPVVGVSGMAGVRMYDIVRVGTAGLMGEVIKLEGDLATVQVYEETEGLRAGEEVQALGRPLTVELGPGLLSSFFDGIQRPLKDLSEHETMAFIRRGVQYPALDRKVTWQFTPLLKVGDEATPGAVLGTVKEFALLHKILIPPHVKPQRIIEMASEGSYTLDDTVAVLEDGTTLGLSHHWPVRAPRPYVKKLDPSIPFVTGMRILDTFFPVALGGNAIIPGGFGTGKTVTQQSLAKWSDVDVIVYVGCGERGNEMTEVLNEFPQLEDPRSGAPLMHRTVLVANTSNMPVAAREASIYVGVTIAEYYRDMGYSVAMMADSTSRWGEALREVSGRLEEMPGEEGYPAYLATRLAAFYERSGRVIPLSANVCETRLDEPTEQELSYKTASCEGSVTMVGAVSPAGGDMSEPITQNSLRVTGGFWALDSDLAHRRHFPAISWTKSYTLFLDQVVDWYRQNVATDWAEQRKKALTILQKEIELNEIVQLVGPDALPDSEKLTLEIARMVREDFLQQSAFDDIDAYCSSKKQYDLLDIVLLYADEARAALERGAQLSSILSGDLRSRIALLKTSEPDEFETSLKKLKTDIRAQMSQLEVE